MEVVGEQASATKVATELAEAPARAQDDESAPPINAGRDVSGCIEWRVDKSAQHELFRHDGGAEDIDVNKSPR